MLVIAVSSKYLGLLIGNETLLIVCEQAPFEQAVLRLSLLAGYIFDSSVYTVLPSHLIGYPAALIRIVSTTPHAFN